VSLLDRIKAAPQRRKTVEAALTDKQLSEVRQIVKDYVLTGRVSLTNAGFAISEEYGLNKSRSTMNLFVSKVIRELEKADRTTKPKREKRGGSTNKGT
jgi:hypothetical protein